jgi:hypothetical protein
MLKAKYDLKQPFCDIDLQPHKDWEDKYVPRIAKSNFTFVQDRIVLVNQMLENGM